MRRVSIQAPDWWDYYYSELLLVEIGFLIISVQHYNHGSELTIHGKLKISSSALIKKGKNQKIKKSKNIYKIPLTNKARSATGSVTSLDAWSHCLYPNTKQDTDSQFKICKVFTDASVRSDLKRVSRAAIIFRTCSWV